MQQSAAAHINVKIHARPSNNSTKNQLHWGRTGWNGIRRKKKHKKKSSITLSFTHNTVLTYSTVSCVRHSPCTKQKIEYWINSENTCASVCACRALHIYSFWFFLSHDFFVLWSPLCVCLSLNEHLPLYCALIGRKCLLDGMCIVRACVCASFLLFSSRFMWSSSCRAERSGNNGGACAAYGVCVLREMPVAPMYELVRCTHFTIAVCSYTYISMSRCRKFTLRLLYKGRQVPCRSHIRTCLRRANNSLSFSWVLWKLEKFENSKIRKYKPSNFHFSFKQVNQNWCKRDTKSAVTFNQ